MIDRKRMREAAEKAADAGKGVWEHEPIDKTVEGALLEAEQAITARLAGYDPRRDRAAIAATHMAALTVKRLRTGETATEIEPSFVVVPREPSVFAVARAISTATTHGLITDGGQTYVYAQPTHNSMRAALIEYAEKGNV